MAHSCLDEATSKEVIRQVEFYFSDSNIPRDKFLKNAIQSTADGLVDLNLICAFNKMRGYLKLGDVKPEEVEESTVKAVADTLRKSSTLKISEDGKRVGRKLPLPSTDEVIEQLDARTVAASPLKYNIKREEVESFFNEFAKVSSVRLPRHVSDKKVFGGTALIEFSSEKDAENALKHSFVLDNINLEIVPKKIFDAEREKMIAENVKPLRNGAKNSPEEQDYPKGVIVSFTIKKKPTTDDSADVEDSNKNTTSSHTEEDETKAKTVENGVKNGVNDHKNDKNVVLREDLKSAIEKFGIVKFIDFKIGDESGHIRFEEPEAAQKLRAAAVLSEEGGVIVKNFIASFEQVTGDAEKEYWKLLRGGQSTHRENRGGRGRGRGQKRTRFNDRDSNDRKSLKV